jgi:hypothetical protein
MKGTLFEKSHSTTLRGDGTVRMRYYRNTINYTSANKKAA